MPSVYHCLIHGLVLSSQVELPLPRIAPRPADVTYRVAPGTELPESTFSRSDDADDPWFVEHWLGSRLAVEFPGRATFELSRNEVVLVADITKDLDLVAHLLLDHVIPRVVALRGDLMLHAAGTVGPSGRAHLFLGRTGAGKSTIVTALAANGWPLLDDDGIRVIDDHGTFRAVPGAAGVRLLPDSAAVVLPGVRPGRPISEGNPKRRFAFDGQWLRMAATPVPIAGVYLLERLEGPDPAVERFGFADALAIITEHGFHLADEPTSITRNAFERASALAAATPVCRLSHPSALDRLAATKALLTELDRDL